MHTSSEPHSPHGGHVTSSPTTRTDAAEVSRMMWDAREAAEMFADIVEARTGKPDTQNRELVKRLDLYRAERGWNPHGFGGEQ